MKRNSGNVLAEILKRGFLPEADDWMQDDSLQSKYDIVLRYCLAHHENLSHVEQRLLEEAIACYRKAIPQYDGVLGDFIPDKFKEKTRQLVARKAYDKGDNPTAAEDWSVYLSKRKGTASNNRPLGITTGLPNLDQSLGGLRGLTVLAGSTGVGKTSLALSIVVAALKDDDKLAVLYYSLDMDKAKVFDWIVSHEAGVSTKSLLSQELTEQEEQDVRDAEQRLQDTVLPRLRIVETPIPPDYKEFSSSSIDEDIGSLQKHTKACRVLTVIDLFHLMDVPHDLSADIDDNEFRLETIGRFSQSVDYPAIVLSKVRKAHSRQDSLTIDDLYGSVDLAFRADNVLLMWQKSGKVPPGTASTIVRIAKGRDADVGDVPLNFHYRTHRFSCPNRKERPTTDAPKRRRKNKSKAVNPLAGS